MFSYSVLILICFATTAAVALLYGVRPKLNRIFVLTLLISLGMMLVFNTFLTALPIVMYNTNSILGIRVLTFPVEDIGYLIAVVVLLPGLYEKLCHEKRSTKPTSKKNS